MKYDTFEDFEKAVLAQHGEYALRDQWTTGGRTGGSCWDDGNPTYYSRDAEDEPDEEVLDEIIDDAFPDLTFREYRKLQKAGVYDVRNHSESEYYGNYTDYKVRTLDLSKLYKALHDIKAERE